MFIDDILIYSKSKEDHEVHLKLVLELLKKEKLFANAPILSLLDGIEDFLVYYDASNHRLGEASKVENATVEVLRGLDQLKERKEDGTMNFIWVPLIGDVRTLIMDEAHASRYLVHLGAVDRLTKSAYFLAIREYYKMEKLARLYIDKIVAVENKSSHSNTTAKLPILNLGEYEMWVIRINQCFLVQYYALWEVIENDNSWVSVPQTSQEKGTSVTKMSVPITGEEKTNNKNDVMARSLLLMALPNEHQLTFSQYIDAKTMFTTIETRFGGNEATKKTQKTLLAILRVVITQEDLNLRFQRSLPPEWNTHVVVWMNKADIETISIDDLYNNFKIVEQDVKKSVGASSASQNLAFVTASSTSSTNDVNTANHAYEVKTVSPNINTAYPQVSTANFSDNTMYAFMVENHNGYNLLQQDLEQIHEDDLEAMDLKWHLSLLSMRAKMYFQRTGKKIFINANDTVGYDKSKVDVSTITRWDTLPGNVEHQRTKKASSDIKTTLGSKETMKTHLQRQCWL
ncbi:hypothetical protein Tco_1161968 [Tanacetum coccineum]